MEKHCPCGNAKDAEACCLLFISGERSAPTAEALMRSRYTAFTLQDMDYILDTTDPQTRHEFDREANLAWSKQSKFNKLEVLNSEEQGNKGSVEFKAWFQTPDGKNHLHHEYSKFRKQAGTWYFRDGKVVAPPKEEEKA